MKAIAVFCLVAMFCSVLAKGKKEDNKGAVPCLPCMKKYTFEATYKPPTTKKVQAKRRMQPKRKKWRQTVKPTRTSKSTPPAPIWPSANITKVKIAVYYESLCPDSKSFIVQQLAPVWRDFRGVVKVKLVPYGKATHDRVGGKWQFLCHHGADECYGNKIQSCILKDRALQDTEKMELVICLMSQANPDKSLDTCLTQVNKMGESEKIKKCASSAQGDDLLAAYGNKTDSVARPLSFVPTIVINEIFNQATQDEAYTNLKGAVCRVAPHKPSIC